MSRLLDSINSPSDLKNLSQSEVEELAVEIRDELVSTVSVTGGHLASNLGAIELTLALHRIFDTPRDKVIWDVGHQAYTHKLLTGRRDRFKTLRQYEGLSGFTSRDESEYDPFGAGHASTSISAALGMAVARDLSGDDYRVVAVIGDGAITGGMALEALNQAGHVGSNLIVILNDNGMSIAPTVGALSNLMGKVRFDRRFHKAKERSWQILRHLPFSNKLKSASEQVESGVKGLVMPTTLWEELGFTYMGPVDGHDIHRLEEAFAQARDFRKKPALVHVVTTKGKGYQPAEGDAVYFHGVSGQNGDVCDIPSYSEVFARTILEVAREDPRLVVITPAMPEGNCLHIVQAEVPERVFDVGICEQHAVTFAAGLATQNYTPVVAIYSTFLQRAFDQIIHDVCLQDLPMVFAIDRGGIVGDDGKTHQGTLDMSYLTLIPNLIISAPKDENELRHLLYTAIKCGKPMAVRYPRGTGLGVSTDDDLHIIPVGKAEVLREGSDIAVIAIGVTVQAAMNAAESLSEQGIEATVINSRFAKPLDSELILELAGRIKRIITVEENTVKGGFGNCILDLLQKENVCDVQVKCLGVPDKFVEQGTQEIIRNKYGLDAAGIEAAVLNMVSSPEPAVSLPEVRE
ncbi:MAG: 1-deoxy-D-xylulose-5-phosphate synthase [Dehalococcoidales bacterium]|nr:MAG: 1-deoxy-D-xylulose-5-phosphate synthase [Dehalococcoidales bacterium]